MDEPSRVTPCPRCGGAVTETQSVCANCGALLGGVRPPPPRTLTGRAWADFLLGAAALYLTHLATARVLVRGLPAPNPADPQHSNEVLGNLFMVAGEVFWAVLFGLPLYFGARRFYPIVARGAGYAVLILLMVLLGAFFTCRPLLY